MIGFVLNIPYTILGLVASLLSIPISVRFYSKPYAFVIRVKKFWWTVGYMRGARAMAIGHVVLLGPMVGKNDLTHELIHVEQHQRMPLIQPLLYYLELFKNGYKDNKFEKEAYQRSGSVYKE